jgi:hypothetical protein
VKKANALPLAAVVTVLVAGAASAAGPVLGTVPAETPAGAFSGHAYYDLTTGVTQWENNPAPLAAVDVYKNTSSPALFAVSSTDLGAVWGDEVFTTDTGVLDQSDFTIYNSTVSAGLLQSASFYVDYIDANTILLLGAFHTDVIDFGPGGLPPGFYTIITVTGLAAQGIDLTTTDVLIEQGVLTHTGPATRLGVVGLDPVTVGTGTATMFIAASTIDGGAPGYYAIGGIAMANPGYRVAVLRPVPTKDRTWGSVKGMYRDR